VLPAKGTVTIGPGEAISVRTPGGGGYGPADERSAERRDLDFLEERV
jgi:N-methylhydantoinase B/oxoprolinase/acetone carboxylase alpha subunit